jgi:molybdate transport system substrate-binding protein
MQRTSWLRGLLASAAFASGAASAADVHVLTSAGFFRAFSSIVPAFERETGHRVIGTREPSTDDSPDAIPARLARGEAADLVILDGGALDSLARRGLLRADTMMEFVRSPAGTFAGALTANAKEPEAAVALLGFLASPRAAAVMRANGLTPPIPR